MALLQGIKKLFNSRLPDSPIRGVDCITNHLLKPQAMAVLNRPIQWYCSRADVICPYSLLESQAISRTNVQCACNCACYELLLSNLLGGSWHKGCEKYAITYVV
jgi:hypothetical protein